MSRSPDHPDPPTWDSLIADLRAGTGTVARHDVGEWAIAQVRAALGEDWPRRWVERHGFLPAFLDRPATHAVAFAQLVEAGLRLHALGKVTRFKRLVKDWTNDLQPIRQVHVQLQLEVAALVTDLAARLEFEALTPLPRTSRPADVLVSTSTHGQMIVECFAVYNDQATAEAMRYDQELGTRVQTMAWGHDVTVTGHWDMRLSRHDTQQLLATLQSTIEQVAADGIAQCVTRQGIELRVSRGPHSEEETLLLEGPATRAAGWPRAREVINAKARDWVGAPYPVWLRFDLLDGTWLFSTWAQLGLAEKTEWMAALLADAVSDAHVAGVVVSCGQQVAPGTTTEQHTGGGGIIGLKRGLDALRMRETIIVPLSADGAWHAEFWRAAYESEPGWLERALASAALPGIAEIELGWSIPDSREAT